MIFLFPRWDMLVSWRVLPFGLLPQKFAWIHRPFNGCRKLPTVTHPKLPTFSTFIFPQDFLRNPLFERGYEYIYILYNIYIYIYIIYVICIIYIYHMSMTIWLSPFFLKNTISNIIIPTSFFAICVGNLVSCFLFSPEDRVLKRVVWNFLHRLSAPTPLSGDVAGNLAAPGPVVGPWRSTCRLVRRIFGVEQRLQNRAEMWLEWWRLWKKPMDEINGEDGMGRWGGLLDIYLFTMTFDTSIVGIVSFLLCRFWNLGLSWCK